MTGPVASFRSVRRGLSLSSAALAAVALFLSGEAVAQPPSLSGVWQIETPMPVVHTADGKPIPLQPDAAKTYRQNMAMKAKGDLSYDNTSWCSSMGMPRAMMINSPFEIVDKPPFIAFLHQWNWWARLVYLNGVLQQTSAAEAPQSDTTLYLGGADPNGPMGLATGKWEGDTLVVHTTNLIGSTLTDNSGVPHSDALTLTEHLRLRSPDELEDRIEFNDPKTFTRPWETVITYRRLHQDIKEDVCLDRIKAGYPALGE